ncbi:MAG: isoprenylcysteine carboxylmethyltransferase family protein, partial [Novosphingobium sp.]
MSLRRSFGVAPANRGIKTNGLYRFVRHPIYAGYLVLHIGLFILIPSVYNLAVYAVAWAAQIMRIKAEEALLLQDPAYVAFKQRTRFRLM